MKYTLINTEETFQSPLGLITKTTNPGCKTSWRAVVGNRHVCNGETFEYDEKWYTFQDGEITETPMPQTFVDLRYDILNAINRLADIGAGACVIETECESCDRSYSQTIIWTRDGIIEAGCYEVYTFFSRIKCLEKGKFVKIDKIHDHFFNEINKRAAVSLVREVLDFLDELEQNTPAQ